MTRERIQWSLRLSAELLRLLDLFESHGIPALPFKGPALAVALYGDVALREYCDLDVLLRAGDLAKAKSLLVAEGYTTDLPADAARESAYLRARYELHFTTPDGGVPIEIHQAFLPPSYCLRFDYEALWRRLERQPFCDREILALPPADLLLMLCAHGAKHAWAEQNGVSDIARLLDVHAARLDWRALLDQATAIGARRILLLGVSLAAELRQAPVPPDVLAAARADRAVARLSTQLAPQAAQEHLRFFIAARERLRDRLACCARLALMPNEEDYSLLTLPPFLSPLYYPLHALRVAGKYSLASLRGF